MINPNDELTVSKNVGKDGDEDSERISVNLKRKRGGSRMFPRMPVGFQVAGHG